MFVFRTFPRYYFDVIRTLFLPCKNIKKAIKFNCFHSFLRNEKWSLFFFHKMSNRCRICVGIYWILRSNSFVSFDCFIFFKLAFTRLRVTLFFHVASISLPFCFRSNRKMNVVDSKSDLKHGLLISNF